MVAETLQPPVYVLRYDLPIRPYLTWSFRNECVPCHESENTLYLFLTQRVI